VAQAAVEVGITTADGGVAVRAYTRLLDHVLLMLEEIDRLVAPGSNDRPEWAVRSATDDGLQMRVILLPRVPARNALVGLDAWSASPLALVDGVRSLAAEPEIPQYFSQPVIERVDTIGQQVGRRGIVRVAVTCFNGARSPEAPVYADVQRNARRAVEPASTAWSSVTGVLDVISARREKRRVGLLTDHGRAVLCNVEKLSRESVFAAFEKRVVAAGLLRRNASGQAVRLDVESLEVLAPRQHVSARDLLGASQHLTGSLTDEEFMAVLRDR
jgi:hypothetical protein